MEEKRKILEMVRAGEIGVEEALELLQALEGPGPRPSEGLLRVHVDARDGGKPVRIRVNLPLALADLLEAFLPEEAKATLRGKQVNLREVLALAREGAKGRLVEVQAEDPEDGPVHILVEVA
ncbi:SHOCT-like domain-containing protein [Thermus filiformis]|uniref:YvlB/LiaX N-terminal domain-containing protein n=1 Tax=Thermus filiformis TaxID=276 RepID=A0A0A2X9M7_THEFI|nr:hypothetical protein [Thermus filiformis]KGQ21904.1 hypothetical protein THFILI_02240 [Thermus filiformis]